MTPERTLSPTAPPTFDDLYRAYAAELPKWFHRLGLSQEEARDATQTLWLIVLESRKKITANPLDTKNELSKLAANIAQKARRHAVRDNKRYQVANPDQLPGRVPNPEQMAYASQLLDAIDALPEHQRALFIANKIEGRNCPEIAAMTGLTDGNIWIRVWNACAHLRYKLGLPDDERKEKRGVIIAPADIEIPRQTRAAFCAIWSAEGRMPNFGGPKDPPPPPIPWFANAYPAVSQAARGVTLKVNHAILLLLLLLTSAGTVALIWIWEPAKLDTARSGLRVPEPIEEITDVIDEYQGATSAPVSSALPSIPQAPAKPLSSQERRALRLGGSGHTRSGSGSE